MHKHQPWLAVSILLFCLVAIPIGIFGTVKGKVQQPQDAESTENRWFDYLQSDHIAVVRLSGMIVDQEDGPIWSRGESAGSALKQLRKAVKNKHVRAVLLRIDSPGGTVSTSQEIAEAISSLQNNQKPVVVSMGDVSASGGYYIACAAEKIVADPGTITGSIGVIMHNINLKGLGDKLGLQPQVIKSGKFKDIGSPYRAMTPEEKTILQDLILDAYDQFVSAVADGRHMSKEQVKKIADGRIYSGRQALNLGLVDKLGSYTIAMELLQGICKERFHLSEDLPVKESRAENFVSALLESVISPFDFHAGTSIGTAFNNFIPESMQAKYNHQPLWLMQ